ncbi:hypothetical protein [Desulfofustis glycolicus]|uniref:Uncharacterized protein n=1 Tax=Desulfofustis glycolicus DSM 9705 TaxID=1121409 RepID=A0A1M5YUH6_9BACT|nr:hypothetical protein [Desulfofustis glycolicus]SHI15671.1 hypothetical protein SAMN02745124_04463 [Desulfofustis glycolicus DSM 9705]
MEKSEKVDIRDALKTRRQCPKCNHIRGEKELAADYECPKCGIIYDKFVEPILEPELEIDPETIEGNDLAQEDRQRNDSNEEESESEDCGGDGSVEIEDDWIFDEDSLNEIRPRPWRRFFARYLDTVVIGFSLSYLLITAALLLSVNVHPDFTKRLVNITSVRLLIE